MVIWSLDQRHDRPWIATSKSEDLDDLISSKVLPLVVQSTYQVFGRRVAKSRIFCQHGLAGRQQQ